MKKLIILLGLICTPNILAGPSSLVFEDFESAENYLLENLPVAIKKFVNSNLDSKALNNIVYIFPEAKEKSPGNLLFEKIAKHFLPVYCALPNSHKNLITSITFTVLYEDYNARFLNTAGTIWSIMSQAEAEVFIRYQFQKAAFTPPSS